MNKSISTPLSPQLKKTVYATAQPNFFCKRLDSKSIRLFEPYRLCGSYPALQDPAPAAGSLPTSVTYLLKVPIKYLQGVHKYM